jgi:hypothetical protein
VLCRLIDRAGGLDRYLLKTPDRLLHSDVGSDLKFRIGLIHKQRWFEEAAQRRMDATAAALRLGDGSRDGAVAALPAGQLAARLTVGSKQRPQLTEKRGPHQQLDKQPSQQQQQQQQQPRQHQQQQGSPPIA